MSESNLLTIYKHNVQSWSHIVYHLTHDAVQIAVKLSLTAKALFPSSVNAVINTYILPSKQIFGPTTSAAPLLTFTAKWESGQTLERLHFGLGVVVAENEQQKEKSIDGLAWKTSYGTNSQLSRFDLLVCKLGFIWSIL